jgi:cytochrome P450
MLWTLGRNYIETYPRSTYEQGVTRYHWGTSDILYVCDPAIIHEMLVDKADAFSRDEVTHRAFTPVIGRSSLFLAEGPDWRWQRRGRSDLSARDAAVVRADDCSNCGAAGRALARETA